MTDLSSITVRTTLPRWWKVFIYACAIVNRAGISVREKWVADAILRNTRFEIG